MSNTLFLLSAYLASFNFGRILFLKHKRGQAYLKPKVGTVPKLIREAILKTAKELDLVLPNQRMPKVERKKVSQETPLITDLGC